MSPGQLECIIGNTLEKIGQKLEKVSLNAR